MPAPSTSAPSAARTVVVWLEPEQVDLVRAALDAVVLEGAAPESRLRIVGAGCPRAGRSRELAEALGDPSTAPIMPMDDLRAALLTSDADLFLLAAPGDFGGDRDRPAAGAGAGPERAGADDWAVIEQRKAAGGAIVTLEPMPASVLQLHTPTLGSGPEPPAVVLGPGDGAPSAAGSGIAPGGGAGGEWATFAPSFRRGPSMRAAADVIEQVGPIHTVSVEFLAGRAEGSLGARLFDAAETVCGLLGEPESADAAYVWPGRGKVVHPAVSESLRDLSGMMCVNLRFADGRAASIVAGDASVGCGRWSRRACIVGEKGRLVVHDDGFEFIGADGRTFDRSAPVLPGASSAEGHGPAGALLADQLRRMLEMAPPAVPPSDYARVLSVTGAALLSARTGEVESPETILRMARTG